MSNFVPVSSRADESEQTEDKKRAEQADPPAEEIVEEIVVTAERPMTAASDQTIRDRDFATFPRRTASDLMRLVPGLHITQHTGGAKAHQIFLRGFDAEHGQDIAATLDGVPLNEVSHVHGQGYLDLHFLIPEVIRRIRVLKGPYDARLGNFSTAGSVRFETEPDLPETMRFKVGAGMFRTVALLGEVSLGDSRRGGLVALQAERTDGFSEPGDLAAIRAFARGRTFERGGWTLDALYAGYAARSRAADTLPLNWIKAGRIGRFGSLDDSNRVDVDRHLVGLTLRGPVAGGRLATTAYYNFKDSRIFSNFSYYYFDPVRGDQLEQSDMRHYGGLSTAWVRTDPLGADDALVSEVGLQWRVDAVWQTQARTARRVRFDVLNHYAFREHGLGLYARETFVLGERWTLVAGLRYDAQLVWIEGTQDTREFDIYTNQTIERNDQPRDAFAHAHIASPKLAVAFQARPDLKLFVDLGRGFVTRPARDQANQSELMPYAVTAAEVGARYTTLGDSLSIASALWWTHKDRELVFDSEFGGTVFRGQSHRAGLELEIRWAPVDWAWIATDVFLTYARLYSDGDWDPIPNTPWALMTNVLAVKHPMGLQASLRGRFLGPRQHDLGLTSDPYYLLDLVVAWEGRHWGLSLTIENLLDTHWYDSVFAYPTRPAPNGPVDEGLQVTAGTPFSARLALMLKI